MSLLKCFLCACLFGGISAKSNKPNIILLVIDDLGWNDIGFHGSNEIPTPNIDALAYNGMILNRHYTQPTCTPSRAALMTGKYPIRLGMQGNPIGAGSPFSLPLDEKLLPQYLKDLGYSTGLIGKWHLGYYKNECTPTWRGFDSYLGYYNGWVRYNDSVTSSFPDETGTILYGIDAWENGQHAGEKFHNEYNTDVFTDEAINMIKAHDTEKPLFLDLSYTAVHAIAESKLQVRDFEENEKRFAYIKDPNRRMFAGVLSAVDESVGKIIGALHEKSMLDNSIVMVIADNGGATEDKNLNMFQNHASNWPLRGWKASVTEGGVRGVAAIWSTLIHKKNFVSQNKFHLTDWLPTFYAAAGGDPSQLGNIDGINQWHHLTDPSVKPPRNEILVNINEETEDQAIIQDDWKFIKVLKGATDFEGSSGREDEYEYNMTFVLTSPTHQTLSLYSDKTYEEAEQTSREFWRQRNQAKIDKHCKNRINDTNNENGANSGCFEEGCLFNISEDDCEFNDLSQKHPKIVEELRRKLDEYRKNLVKQHVNKFDSNSNPKYFQNYWTPWISEKTSNLRVNSEL